MHFTVGITKALAFLLTFTSVLSATVPLVAREPSSITNIQPVVFKGEVNGRAYEIAGTVEQVLAELKERNPDFELKVNRDLETLAPRNKVQPPLCIPVRGQDWIVASNLAIMNEIDSLNKLNAPISIVARSCGQIACTLNSAIYLCNDNDYGISPWSPYLASYAYDIVQSCTPHSSVYSGGQEFDTDRYNIIVRAVDSCGTTITRREGEKRTDEVYSLPYQEKQAPPREAGSFTNVQPAVFRGEVDGHAYELTGTAQSVWAQLKERHPEIELKNEKRDLTTLAPRNKVQPPICVPVPGQDWLPTPSAFTQQNVDYLNVLNARISVGAKSCVHIACWWPGDPGGSIYLCNDNNYEIEPASPYLASYATDIMNDCKINGPVVYAGGQEFDTDNYNVIVRRQDGSC